MSTTKEPAYASATAVAGLAREVEALRMAVEPLTSMPAQVDELARVVGQLAESVANTGDGPAGALSWLGLAGEIPTVRSVLVELTGWMGEVFLRYADAAQGLPACWMWHPDIVEELLWLMYAWLAAYRDDDATVARAGDWHDRYRPGVVRRIKTLAGACSLENHQPRGDRYAPGPVVPLAQAMEPIAEWWATRRDDVAPEPDQDHLAAAAATHRRAGGRR